MHKSGDRRTSVLWRHFAYVTDFRAECLHCNQILGKSKGTSNLLKHLQRKHSKVFSELNFAKPNRKICLENHPVFSVEENVRNLIQLIRIQPTLYTVDTSCDKFELERQNYQIWDEISKQLNASLLDCQRCWYTLRLLNLSYVRSSGSFEFPYCDDLSFLDEQSKFNKINNIKQEPITCPGKVFISIPSLSDDPIHEINVEKTDEIIDTNSFGNYEVIYEECYEDHVQEQNNSKKSIKKIEEKESKNENKIIQCAGKIKRTTKGMDEIDYFIEFLHRKLRQMTSSQSTKLQMKFMETLRDAELRSINFESNKDLTSE